MKTTITTVNASKNAFYTRSEDTTTIYEDVKKIKVDVKNNLVIIDCGLARFTEPFQGGSVIDVDAAKNKILYTKFGESRKSDIHTADEINVMLSHNFLNEATIDYYTWLKNDSIRLTKQTDGIIYIKERDV